MKKALVVPNDLAARLKLEQPASHPATPPEVERQIDEALAHLRDFILSVLTLLGVDLEETPHGQARPGGEAKPKQSRPRKAERQRKATTRSA